MEINKSTIKNAIKLLQKIPFNPTSKMKSTLFFPLNNSTNEVADNEFVITSRLETGSTSFLKPGIVLEAKEGKTICCFGYATTEYAKEFDLKGYLSILSGLKEKEINEIASCKCYLVNDANLMAEFLFEVEKPKKETKKK